MKILILNTAEHTGGAAVAANRLLSEFPLFCLGATGDLSLQQVEQAQSVSGLDREYGD